jgi:hypothetical protein
MNLNIQSYAELELFIHFKTKRTQSQGRKKIKNFNFMPLETSSRKD